MSDPGPPRKKAKVGKGHPSTKNELEYRHTTNKTLFPGKDCIRRLLLDELIVAKNNNVIYAGGCWTCVAIIIVAKMDNNEIWHGMMHVSKAANTDEINTAFSTLRDGFNKTNTTKIENMMRYLVTVPELKEKREKDVKELKYEVTVLCPDVEWDVEQIDDITPKGEHSAITGLTGSVNVRLIKQGIIMKYETVKPLA